MSDRIDSVEELKKAQAAAQMQGASITNYNEWADILESLDELGIQSSGSYSGDVRLFSEVMNEMKVVAEEIQKTQAQNQIQPSNNEVDKIQEKSSQDKEQNIKANIANNSSSEIVANYMKFYHLL